MANFTHQRNSVGKMCHDSVPVNLITSVADVLDDS